MTEANGKVRRGRAPGWLRILTGIMIFGGVLLLADAELPAPLRPASSESALLVLFIAAGFVSCVVVRKLSTRVAVSLWALVLLGEVWLFFATPYQGDETLDIEDASPPVTPRPPLTPTLPAPMGPPPAPQWQTTPSSPLPAPSPLPSPPPSPPSTTLPEFPWPPPAASASYVLPHNLFKSRRTVGQVVVAILLALERNGYVERSFFQTEARGVALVTRLERINDDGSSFVERGRWPAPASERYRASTDDLILFLRGLFFVDPGHYRVIVFILQDLPFSQSSQRITEKEARAWLVLGMNILPPEIAASPFGDGHCTVLIYEFASDGTAVRVVESRITGKQHLEKAGLLSLLEKVN